MTPSDMVIEDLAAGESDARIALRKEQAAHGITKVMLQEAMAVAAAALKEVKRLKENRQ